MYRINKKKYNEIDIGQEHNFGYINILATIQKLNNYFPLKDNEKEILEEAKRDIISNFLMKT